MDYTPKIPNIFQGITYNKQKGYRALNILKKVNIRWGLFD